MVCVGKVLISAFISNRLSEIPMPESRAMIQNVKQVSEKSGLFSDFHNFGSNWVTQNQDFWPYIISTQRRNIKIDKI